jgi:endonuclease/exonuclease/phosphatase family metal-dependent hydrolase
VENVSCDSKPALDPIAHAGSAPSCRLRILSYNIQAGTGSEHYHEYLTHGWKHILPHHSRWHNLDRIAQLLGQFDIVGLQEVDPGSLRTGFINQTKYLAERAGFPFWHHQTNRRVGNLTQHSNGLLSRVEPHSITEHRLPGLPGRGALVARLGSHTNTLNLIILHLALGKRARLRQMSYLADVVNRFSHAVLMGDLNCELGSQELDLLLRDTSLRAPETPLSTFPSWRPRRHLDHILVTSDVRVEKVFVPPWTFSDHLPVAMEVTAPVTIHF